MLHLDLEMDPQLGLTANDHDPEGEGINIPCWTIMDFLDGCKGQKMVHVKTYDEDWENNHFNPGFQKGTR